MNKPQILQAKVTDYLLTPLACASLVHEFLKYLLYQKCQIPYPYSWLKSTVKVKRNQNESEKEKNKMDHKFQSLFKAFDTLENMMESISKELQSHSVAEVVIIFGTTPFTPKEVYRINIPSLVKGHVEENHASEAMKYQSGVLRQFFFSDLWTNIADSQLPCTNTHIFVKKCNSEIRFSDKFKPCRDLLFGKNAKVFIIEFKNETSKSYLCCKNLQVFSDHQCKHENENSLSYSSEKKCSLWYQFENTFSGFKHT